MSYPIWTADGLKSDFCMLGGVCWRIVEAQNQVSTLKIVDTLSEQERLEQLLEEVKPPYPPELKNHHYLLFTPFRYAPYDVGSRFRRQHQKEGVFYAAELVETAVAELAFYRLLFFIESPELQIPDNAPEYTAFSVKYQTEKALDLTVLPFSEHQSVLMDPQDYAPCQSLADEARKAGGELLRSFSVRCPKQGKNIAILSPRAFRSRVPVRTQTWNISIKATEIIALCAFPVQSLRFARADFEADPRIKKQMSGRL